MESLKNIGKWLVAKVDAGIAYLKANPNVLIAFVLGFALGVLHKYYGL